MSILKIVLSILRGGQPRCLSFWWDFFWRILFRKNSLVRLRNSLVFFLSYPLVWWCPLLSAYNFLFYEHSDSFLIWLFHSFCYLWFSTFYEHDIFLCQIPFFYPDYIPIVCISLYFFFIFCKQFDVIRGHLGDKFFLTVLSIFSLSAYPWYIIERL